MRQKKPGRILERPGSRTLSRRTQLFVYPAELRDRSAPFSTGGLPKVRPILNAIFYVLRTGMLWRDLSDRYSARTPARQPISQKSVSSRVAPLKIVCSSASRTGVP